MTITKQCLLETKGQLHTRNGSGCGNIYKTCTSPSQKKSWMERRVGHQVTLIGNFWQLEGEGSIFSKIVDPYLSTVAGYIITL